MCLFIYRELDHAQALLLAVAIRWLRIDMTLSESSLLTFIHL